MNAPIRTPDTVADATPVAVPRFVHLKVHSAYSLLEGALPIGRLAKLADAEGMPAVGLTDTNNLFGALEFSDKLAGTGVQPIVGCTLQIDFGDKVANAPMLRRPNEAQAVPAGCVAFYAMSEAGYQNLMKLASRAFFDPAENEPAHIHIKRVEALGEGLI